MAFQNITLRHHLGLAMWLMNYLFQLQDRKDKPAFDNSD